MFKNTAQLTDEDLDLDFEQPEPKRRKQASFPTPALSQPAKSVNKKPLDNRKDFNLAATQFQFPNAPVLAAANRPTDDFNAVTILLREAGLEKYTGNGYYTVAEIQKAAESNSLPRGKVPVMVCSIISFSVKSAHGDAVLAVRDQSGSISACIQRSLLRTLQPNVLSIRGAALLLTGVSLMSVRQNNGGLLSFTSKDRRNLYLNVTPRNIVCVYFKPPVTASVSSTENSYSSSGTAIRRIFCQPGVSSPSTLTTYVEQYVAGFFDSSLPSVSYDQNAATSNGGGQQGEEMMDDVDMQTLTMFASAFDDD